jgi:hypothetical protein
MNNLRQSISGICAASVLSIGVGMTPAPAVAQHNGGSPCSLAYARGIPCVRGQTQNLNWYSTAPTPPIKTPSLSAPAPSQGTTVATVNTQFPAYMNWVFIYSTPAVLNAKMTFITDLDLARFSSVYGAATGGNFTLINTWAKAKFTPANWARWENAVNPVMPVAIKQSYADYTKRGINPKIQWGLWPAANPTTDMTVREIYSEFLWTSAETETEALLAASAYITANLHLAAAAGYALGTAFYAFASAVDPDYGFDLTTTYLDDNFEDFGTPSGIVTIEWGDLVTNWIDELGDSDYWVF